MTEVVWDMSQAPYSLDSTGDAKVITATAIADADTFFNDVANKDTTLVLYYPPGDYHFQGTPTTSESAAIRIISFVPGGTSDAGKLVFRGAGRSVTKFIVYNNQSVDGSNNSTSQYGILCRNCRRIEFHDFHLTTSQQTVSQGTVQAVGVGYVDLLVPPGFRTPIELEVDPPNGFGRYLRQYTYAFDPNNPRLIQTNNDQIRWTTSADQGGGVWRLSTIPINVLVPYAIGSVIAIKGKHGLDPFRILTSFNIEMHNLQLSRKTRSVFIESVDTVVSNWLIERETINGLVACLSSPEGGPQFQSSVGGTPTGTPTTGLSVSGCRITGTGDDCIGLFEQAGTVQGNIVRDSFARGIVNVDHSTGLTGNEVSPNNTFIRCPYLELES